MRNQLLLTCDTATFKYSAKIRFLKKEKAPFAAAQGLVQDQTARNRLFSYYLA
jgi:hypothetical protein